MAIDLQTAFATVVHTDDGTTFARLETAFASVVHGDDGTTFARLETAFASVVHGDDGTTFARLETAFSSVVSEQPLTVAIISNTPATATIANPFTFIGSNSVADTWEWSFTTVPAGSAIPVGPAPLPDNQATTPVNMTDNEALYHFDGVTTDTSGNAQNGTAVGSPSYVAGQVGQAISLNGTTGQYVSVPNSPIVTITSDITISAWINATLTGDSFQRIVGKSTGGNGAGGYALIVHTTGQVYFTLNGSAINSAAGSVTASTWTNVAGVWDSATGTGKIYVDGVEVQSGALPAPGSSTANLHIGADPAFPGTRDFNGALEEVAIFSRAVPESEVFQAYKFGTGVYALTEDLTFIPDVTGVYDVDLNVFGRDEGESQTDSDTGEVTGNLGVAEYPIGQFASRKTDLIGRFAFPFVPKIEE
jgi:hypothetical protein